MSGAGHSLNGNRQAMNGVMEHYPVLSEGVLPRVTGTRPPRAVYTKASNSPKWQRYNRDRNRTRFDVRELQTKVFNRPVKDQSGKWAPLYDACEEALRDKSSGFSKALAKTNSELLKNAYYGYRHGNTPPCRRGNRYQLINNLDGLYGPATSLYVAYLQYLNRQTVTGKAGQEVERAIDSPAGSANPQTVAAKPLTVRKAPAEPVPPKTKPETPKVATLPKREPRPEPINVKSSPPPIVSTDFNFEPLNSPHGVELKLPEPTREPAPRMEKPEGIAIAPYLHAYDARTPEQRQLASVLYQDMEFMREDDRNLWLKFTPAQRDLAAASDQLFDPLFNTNLEGDSLAGLNEMQILYDALWRNPRNAERVSSYIINFNDRGDNEFPTLKYEDHEPVGLALTSVLGKMLGIGHDKGPMDLSYRAATGDSTLTNLDYINLGDEFLQCVAQTLREYREKMELMREVELEKLEKQQLEEFYLSEMNKLRNSLNNFYNNRVPKFLLS